jgi:DNA-binding IclR family transcriptional regulator
MEAPLADRILEVIGDESALAILRGLDREERTQAALVIELKLPQSVASRTIKTLRHVGLVVADSPRGVLRIRAPVATRQLLLAGNNLASALLAIETAEQANLSDETRRSAIKAADAPAGDLPKAGR